MTVTRFTAVGQSVKHPSLPAADVGGVRDAARDTSSIKTYCEAKAESATSYSCFSRLAGKRFFCDAIDMQPSLAATG